MVHSPIGNKQQVWHHVLFVSFLHWGSLFNFTSTVFHLYSHLPQERARGCIPSNLLLNYDCSLHQENLEETKAHIHNENGFSNLLSQSEHYYVNKFKRSGASNLLSFQGHHSSVENGSLKQKKTSPLNHDGWRNSICKFPSQSFWEPLVVSHRSPRPSTAPAGRFGRPSIRVPIQMPITLS